jgi:hypothetical protein
MISPVFPHSKVFLGLREIRVNAFKTPDSCAFSKRRIAGCTSFGHMPVAGVHSIEMQADRVAWFLLTLKIESVKESCSLTRSKV